MKAKIIWSFLIILTFHAFAINPTIAQQAPRAAQSPEATYKQTLNTAKLKKDYITVIKMHYELGGFYVKHNEPLKAKDTFNQGVSVAKQYLQPNHPLTGIMLVKASTPYMLEQDFDKALKLLHEGISILEKNPGLKMSLSSLKQLESLLGNFNSGLLAIQKEHDYPKAEQSFKVTLENSRQLNEPTLLSISSSLVGLVQVIQDKDVEAESSLQQAMQYAQSAKSAEGRFLALIAFGELYSRRGDIVSAKKYYEIALTEGTPVLERFKINKAIFEQELQKFDMIEKILNESQASASAEDYTKDALMNNKVLRWNDQTTSIKVYMPPGNFQGWKEDYPANFKKACIEWQNILNNKIQFEFTENPMDKVDTVVTWNADYNPRAGLTEYNYIGGKLFKADIHFHLKTFDNKLYDPNSIYKVSLHELGHLLGITGHSKNPNDIMFPTLTRVIKPSARDIATLSALYSQKAEITNPTNMTLAEFREAHKDLLTKATQALQHF